jgi:hypothetical protein
MRCLTHGGNENRLGTARRRRRSACRTTSSGLAASNAGLFADGPIAPHATHDQARARGEDSLPVLSQRSRRRRAGPSPWQGCRGRFSSAGTATTAGHPGPAAPSRDLSRKPEPAANPSRPISVFPATAPPPWGRVGSVDCPHRDAKRAGAQPPAVTGSREAGTGRREPGPAPRPGPGRGGGWRLAWSPPAPAGGFARGGASARSRCGAGRGMSGRAPRMVVL